ncbi:hypothetical protein GCM10010492_44330 [Saccharothrix mutabilis subsp. mutabilis]|uniref:Uncharacterized protein n=1 Tax=Saccharothrix mutabilis subsp. mutabilis TaxID=66855 RepID=A0ABN0U6G7_9PSEU
MAENNAAAAARAAVSRVLTERIGSLLGRGTQGCDAEHNKSYQGVARFKKGWSRVNGR